MATPPPPPPPSATTTRPKLLPGRIRDAQGMAHLRRRRTRRILASEGVFDSIVSLAGLVGRPVRNQRGEEIGRLEDVVARWDDGQMYPPVSGLVIRVGRRRAFVPASAIDRIGHAEVLLRSSRLDLRDVVRRQGEVLLAKDVLDHQLVDVEGVQVIRAADLYLAEVIGRIRLVGADVSNATLLRRLGPQRWRPRPTPDRVIDWAAIQPFTEQPADHGVTAATQVRLRTTNEGLHRLRPGELADLLEDLRRDERRELLAALSSDEAADALEEMQPEDLEQLLRETDPVEAARLVGAMEPDEAVDALRDLPLGVRAEVLRHIPAKTALALRELLGYEEDEAGGIMTTTLVTATSGTKVRKVVDRLAELRGHGPDIDAVAVVDSDGRLVGDVTLVDILLALRADSATRMSALLGEELLTIDAHVPVSEVAGKLVESRRHSLVVVDEDSHPIGRILADDVLDALVPTKGRFHFPRLLS